jgi:hypothetical protein
MDACYVNREAGGPVMMTNEELNEYLNNLPGDFPGPSEWMVLYEMLPDAPDGSKPPLPMVLGALGVPKLAKMIRFREHIEWADKHGALPMVAVFLMVLPPEGWEK